MFQCIFLNGGDVNYGRNVEYYLIPQYLYNKLIKNIKTAIGQKMKRGICRERQTRAQPDLYDQHQSYYLHNAPKNLVNWIFADLLTNIAIYINDVSLQHSNNIRYTLNSGQIGNFLKKLVCVFVYLRCWDYN